MSPHRPDLLAAFFEAIPDELDAAVAAAVEASASTGARLYLVGGPVRDLLLGRPSLDVDIAVEGDVEALALELERRTGARVVRHGRFGTATLRLAGHHVDFARTRRETYARPGALPDVEEAGIEEDLARRDFTVNALALSLTPPEGALLDPFDGAGDIGRRLVRVLHDGSFQDDPTRMLRACRYVPRLDFELEPGTRALLVRDLDYVDKVSGPRLRRELALIFQEPAAVAAIALAQELGLLAKVHPLLRLRPEDAQSWREALAGERLAPPEELGFAMVSAAASEAEVDALSRRLHLTGRVEAVLLGLVRLRAAFAKLDAPETRPSEAVSVLEHQQPAAVWALGLQSGGRVRERCLQFLHHWRSLKPRLHGRDLEALGMTPGPEMGRALARLRQARLDGEVETREDEVELLRREFGDRLGRRS